MAWQEAFHVSWAHLDGNAHMANTAFMAVAIDCRFHYFATRGVTPAEFAKWRIGPVVRRAERSSQPPRLATRAASSPSALRDLERTADYADLESSVRPD